MEPVTIRLENKFLKDIEKTMKEHRYTTKTEFIREAIREKIKELEKQEALARVRRLYGTSKRKTTDEELHKVGEEFFNELKEEMGIK
mgnify:CR=1 FL=1